MIRGWEPSTHCLEQLRSALRHKAPRVFSRQCCSMTRHIALSHMPHAGMDMQLPSWLHWALTGGKQYSLNAGVWPCAATPTFLSRRFALSICRCFFLERPRLELFERIDRRVEQMVDRGLLQVCNFVLSNILITASYSGSSELTYQSCIGRARSLGGTAGQGSRPWH